MLTLTIAKRNVKLNKKCHNLRTNHFYKTWHIKFVGSCFYRQSKHNES